jgi:BlaI family penicillinase repressor
MSGPRPSQPTTGELAILDVLWDRGPSTVRQVHETLRLAGASTGYTTVLKLMQIMARKGWVERDETERSHIYRPAVSQQRAQRGLVGDLIDRAFSGSTSALVLRALSAKPVSAQELVEIRRFLDEQENRRSSES